MAVVRGALDGRGRRFFTKIPMTILSQLTQVIDSLHVVYCILISEESVVLPLKAIIDRLIHSHAHLFIIPFLLV